MILKDADDKQGDIDALHRLADEASTTRQRRDVQSQIDNIAAGVRGERDAAYYINQEFRHRTDAVVIHDLRLEEDGDVAQIDHLIVCDRRKAVVVETKAFGGEISCNDAGEWHVIYSRKKLPIGSPLEQSKRHAAMLRRWLAKRDTALREVIPVVLVAPTAKVGQRAPSLDDTELVKSDLFARWFEKKTTTSSSYAIQRDHELMDEDALVSIGRRFVQAHAPINFDWRKRFGFPSMGEAEVSPSGGGSSIENRSPAVVTPPPDGQQIRKKRRYVDRTVVAIEDGELIVFHYENGDRGIRCEQEGLRTEVAAACRERGGRYLPTPKLWMLTEEMASVVIHDLAGGTVREEDAAATAPSNGDATPDAIITPHGNITIARIGDAYAIRNPNNSDVIGVVKTACRGRGKWIPRYRNWLIEASEISAVVVDLRAAAARLV